MSVNPVNDDLAIDIEGLVKDYPMYSNRLLGLAGALGVGWMVPGWKEPPVHTALRDLTLKVRKGERVAIIGRNGAGKSTLLKLIAGTILPTKGRVGVYGQVSALLDLGVGFNEDMTGYMNLRGALAYNNLSRAEVEAAIEDVVSFCELGPHLHQPVKTYSAGMKSRLFFAVSTAIKPDILIVDEVLGAGDAYFSQKSAERIARLTGGGCTILLVSHNPGHVLEMCSRAIWIENGAVQMEGAAPDVLGAYNTFVASLEEARTTEGTSVAAPTQKARWLRDRLLADMKQSGHALGTMAVESAPMLSLNVVDGDGTPSATLKTGVPAAIHVTIERSSEVDASGVRPVIFIFTTDGRYVSHHVGPHLTGQALARTWVMRFNPLLLGSGEYLITGGLYRPADERADDGATGDRAAANGGTDIDGLAIVSMLQHSLKVDVLLEDRTDTSLICHPAAWRVVDTDCSVGQDG